MRSHDDDPEPTQTSTAPAMRAARAPVGAGSAPLVAQLLALALVALGAVGIQEALVRTGAISTASWTSAVVDSVDGCGTTTRSCSSSRCCSPWSGCVLLPLGFLRRPRTAVALDATTGVYLRTRDLARVAAAAVEGADAVTDVA